MVMGEDKGEKPALRGKAKQTVLVVAGDSSVAPSLNPKVKTIESSRLKSPEQPERREERRRRARPARLMMKSDKADSKAHPQGLHPETKVVQARTHY